MKTTTIEAHTGCELGALLEQPFETTLARLGESVVPLGGLPLGLDQYISAGRRWLDDRRKAICEVCASNQILADYMKGGRSYKVTQIIGILFDLVCLTFRLPPAGAAWASVALVQLGLEQFCDQKCEQPKSESTDQADIS
jgi:hypothetical protein